MIVSQPEQRGAILLVSSPQDSRTPTMPETDLLSSRVFAKVIKKFDSALEVEPAGSLNPESQLASPVMSVAAHTDFVVRLREKMRPDSLIKTDDAFKIYLTGHSVGEMASLVEAGVWDIETMAQFLKERERVTTHPYGSAFKYMMAVAGVDIDNFELPLPKIVRAFGEKVRIVLANRNTPSKGVFSIDADEDSEDALAEQLPDLLAEQKHPLADKISIYKLPMKFNFHSPNADVAEMVLNHTTDLWFNDSNYRTPSPGVFYSPMLNGWVNSLDQAIAIRRHQLTMGVNFRGAVQHFAEMDNLVAIVTADVKGVTPKLVSDNFTDKSGVAIPKDKQIPIFNIRNEKTMQEAVLGSADLLDRYKHLRA